jgi:hypothetical protein
VVDIASGGYTYVTEGVEPSVQPLPAGSVLRGPTGAFTYFAAPASTIAEVLWFRSGVSAWSRTIESAGFLVEEMVVAETKHFSVLSSPTVPVPTGFQRGDLLVILDRRQRAYIGTVDAQLDAVGPGSVSFATTEPYVWTFENSKPATVTLMRLANTSAAGSVRLELGGNAVAGVHYQPFDPVVRFAAGEVFKDVLIQPIDDQVWSGVAKLDLSLGERTNLTAGIRLTNQVVVFESDPAPSFGFTPLPAPIVLTETDTPAAVPFTVTKLNPTRVPAIVTAEWEVKHFAVIAKGAVQVTFAPGETEKTFEIPIPGNDSYEGTRQVNVELKVDAGVVRNGEDERTITVKDDERPQVTAQGRWVKEGNAVVVATLATVPYRDHDQPVTLTWRTVDGTAKAGRDYTEASGTFTNFDGDEWIYVKTAQDEELEGEEEFYIEISSATGADILNQRGIVTIRDNSYPQVWITPTDVREGAAGTRKDVNLHVRFSRPTVFPSVLSLVRETSLHSFATAGRDYDASWENVPIHVPEGVTSIDIKVPILGDDESEGTELLRLTTGQLLGFRSGSVNGILTIQDDDPPPALPHVTVGPGAEATEGGTSPTLNFLIQRLEYKPGTSIVSWHTEDGTAVAGSDYVASSGTVELTDQKLSATVQVPIIDDGTDENDETFSIVIDTPVNATLDFIRATNVIRDDDVAAVPPPAVEIAGATGGEAERAMTFTLTLSTAWPVPVMVKYRTLGRASGADFAPVEYGSVTFAPGERMKTVTVEVFDDPFVDPGDSIALYMWSGIAVVPKAEVYYAIEDDESAPKRHTSRH